MLYVGTRRNNNNFLDESVTVLGCFMYTQCLNSFSSIPSPFTKQNALCAFQWAKRFTLIGPFRKTLELVAAATFSRQHTAFVSGIAFESSKIRQLLYINTCLIPSRIHVKIPNQDVKIMT